MTRLTWWRRVMQIGVKAQSGDESDGFMEGLAAVEEVERGVAIISHQHQGTLGQPATQLHYHLARPVGDLLVAASLLLVVPRGRRQHGEHRQGPMASRPGDVAQPHHRDPAQCIGLGHLRLTGTYGIPVDAPVL